MEHHFHFLFLNPVFDQEIADEEHNGQETEDNIKFLWEDELIIPSVGDVTFTENGTYNLIVYKGRKKMKFPIKESRLISVPSGENQVTEMVVTEDLIENYELKKEEGNPHHYFTLKSMQEPHNPVKGIYISGFHFPEELSDEKE